MNTFVLTEADSENLQKIRDKTESEFLKFMSTIIKRVEITIPENVYGSSKSQNKMCYFLMQPQSMYLERMSQKEFIQQIDVNDPRNYLTQYMKLLLLEMDGNYDLSRRSNLIYNLTKNDVLTYHKYFAWCVGLGINLWCISVLHLDNNDERSERKLVSDVHLKSINIVS